MTAAGEPAVGLGGSPSGSVGSGSFNGRQGKIPPSNAEEGLWKEVDRHHLTNTCFYSLSSSQFLSNLPRGVWDRVKVQR